MSRKPGLSSPRILALLCLGAVVAASTGIVVEYRSSIAPITGLVKAESRIILDRSQDVGFFVLGDSGSGKAAQHQVAQSMEQQCRNRRPDGILFVGDVIYPSGARSVEDPQWEDKVFSVYGGECLADVPLFPVLGNHDYDGNIRSWMEIDKRHPRWNFPSRHYSIVVPDLLTIYALDTNFPFQITSQGIRSFGDSTTPWTIAIGHHPMISVSNRGPSRRGRNVRSWMLRYLLCGEVDAYIAGHNHHLEYDDLESCSMAHLISGAGGGVLYGVLPEHDAEFAASRYGFLELRFTRDVMHSRFISGEGETLFARHIGNTAAPSR